MGTSSAGGYQYGYTNPIPGSFGESVAGTVPDSVVVTGTSLTNPFHDAVTSPGEAGMFDVNPAFAPAVDVSQQQEGQINPEVAEPLGAEDTDNPEANENSGDEGPTKTNP
jgi:hypothetical protein